MNLIISKALPLSTVDDPSFIALINGLNPRANVMGAKKLRTLIEEEKKKFEEELKSALAFCQICMFDRRHVVYFLSIVDRHHSSLA